MKGAGEEGKPITEVIHGLAFEERGGKGLREDGVSIVDLSQVGDKVSRE